MKEDGSDLLKALGVGLDKQKKEKEKVALVRQFTDLASETLWKYGPVKIHSYSISYSYPYFEPGIHQIPEATLQIGDLQVSAYIEGEFVTTESSHTLPHQTKLQRLSLILKSDEESSALTVIFPVAENMSALPDNEMLRLGKKIMEQLNDEYQRRGIKTSPRGHNGYY